MSNEWSTQRPRRVRLCAVLAMHVPNLVLHTLGHFLCASLTPSFSPQVKENVLAADAFPWGAGHGTLRDTRK